MKIKQVILLFLALLLPICIFFFLKGFGENEFSVPPLFTDQMPAISPGCSVKPSLPYHIPDSALSNLDLKADSIALVYFAEQGSEKKLSRVENIYDSYPLRSVLLDPSKKSIEKQCIYFLQEPFNAALVDRKGCIRGQYNMNDRDEVDRLITELAIIFKKY